MGLHHPHQVVTLALDGCVLLDVAIPVHVFGYHGGGRYRFTLAGHHRGPVRTSTGVVLHAEAGLRALTTADTVIVPGYEAVLRPPPPSVLASLRAAAARGARLLSICTGAFALAHAGLLDGRRATTHWAAAAQLADRFPGVTVDAGVLYVDDDTILTSAGVAAGLDLCLHVVRRDHGAAVAASIARHTVVAPHRDGDQAQFIQQPIPATQPGGTSLLTTRSWALEHLHERLDLARLARHAGVSPRTFARRFHAETGTTPLQWVLGQRVLLARQLLEQTDLPIETLAHACGFSTAPHLRRHFTRATGTTPTAYRRAFTLHQLTTPTTLTAPTGAVAWSPNAPQEEARLGRLPGRGASEAGRRIDPMNALSQWADLELRHLLALQAIAEYGSFHKAAEHLGYTQSGISQQIAALERIIGERLLERPGGSRPVRLTDAGDVVLRHACAIFDQITAAQADVAALDEISVGVLRVGAFQSVSAKILPQLLRRLAGQRPRLRIELTQTTSDPELFGLLKAGQLDITFAMLPVPEGPFAAVELFADPFVVLAAADSALARRDGRLSVRELAELPLVTAQCCRYTSHVEAQLRERGLEPNVVHRSDDNGTVLGLVAAGAGVALVPRMVAESATGRVTIMEFEERLPPRRVGLSWRNDRNLLPGRDAFVTAVRETCGALGLRAHH